MTVLYNLSQKIQFLKALSILILCSFSLLHAQQVNGSFDVPMSAGDPAEDPTKDRIEALYGQIGVGGGGVSLFTGDASLSIPIAGLSLNYSGNVRKTLASPNQRVQSSWVGTGWTLTMGNISAVQNNTVGLTDDTYYIVTEDGVSGELKQVGTTDEFYLEDYKYWKIERVVDEPSHKIKQWIVTKEDGTKYYYGDNKTVPWPPTDYQGNRYAICWNNSWIGDGTDLNNTSTVPYQWDLTSVEDVFGNEILSIEYQHRDNPTFKNTGLHYTRSSYLESITDNRSGKKIEFELTDRNASEWVDPYPDYDNLTERYEKERLKEIIMFGADGNETGRYDFKIVAAESGAEEGRGKAFLLSITQQDANGNALPPHKFEYVDLVGPDGNGNYTARNTVEYRGAIEKVIYPSGGNTTFSYVYTTDEIRSNNKQVITDGISINSRQRQVYFNDEHFIAIDDMLIAYERQSADDPPVAADYAFLRAWHWNGYSWEKPGGTYDLTYPSGTIDNVLYGDDSETGALCSGASTINNFALMPVLKGFGNKIAMLTMRDTYNASWEDMNENTIERFAEFPNVPDRLLAWHWTGKKWKLQVVDEDIVYDMANKPSAQPLLAMTDNKMAVIYQNNAGTNKGILKTYSWTGTEWDEGETLDTDITFYSESGLGAIPAMGFKLFLTDNHLLVTEMIKSNSGTVQVPIKLWNWNENTGQWVNKTSEISFTGYTNAAFNDVTYLAQISLTNDKLVIVSSKNGGLQDFIEAKIDVWHWDGDSWQKKNIKDENGGEITFYRNNGLTLQVQDDKILVLDHEDTSIGSGTPFNSQCKIAPMHIWHWDGDSYKKDSIVMTYPVTRRYFGTGDPNNREPKVQLMGDKVIVFQPDLKFETYEDVYQTADLRSWHLNKSGENWIWEEYDKGDCVDAAGDTIPSLIMKDFYWDKRHSSTIDMLAQAGQTQDMILVLSDDKPGEGENYGNGYVDFRGWRWTGDKWEKVLDLSETEPFVGEETNYPVGNEIHTRYDRETLFFPMGDRFFITDGANNTIDWGTNEIARDKLYCYMNFNETWSGVEDESIGDVRVISKTTNDEMGGSSVTEIDYKNGVFDISSGTANYNKTTVKYPDSSKEESFFYNNLGPLDGALEWVDIANNTNEDFSYYKWMDGKVYKTKSYNPDASAFSSTKNTYQFNEKYSDPFSYEIQLKKTESTKDGVNSETEFTYCNSNGMVQNKIETNSDGNKRITNTTYAHELLPYEDPQTHQLIYFYDGNSDHVNDMGPADQHRLSQVAQTTVYEDVLTENNAKSSMVTTYKDWGNGYLPERKFVWAEDDPTAQLPSFNSWNSDLNPNPGDWMKTGEVIERDEYGNILEYIDAGGTSTAIKWGYNNAVPIAHIQNAKYNETFYDGFESGDFCGQEICWGYGVASGGTSSREITTEDVHSGEYALKMIKNDDLWSGVYMLSPYVTVIPGKEYTISVWYKCDPGRNAYINWYDFTHSTSHTKTQAGTGEWALIEYPFVAPSGCTKLRVYLYGHSGSAETPIYYDDVRVYPGDAQVISQTYDPSWLKLSSRTDANNNTTYYTYDGFGRIDQVKNNDHQLLTDYDYYYSRDNHANYNPDYPNKITTTTYADNTMVNRTYFDGLGHAIQSQAEDGSNDVVSAIEYNELGNVFRTWKPYLYNGNGYDPSFANNANGYYDGTDGLPNAQGYAYSQTDYKDAFGRIEETGAPGYVFRVGMDSNIGSNTINYEYGTNDAEEYGTYDESTLYKTTTNDENGTKTEVLTDIFGNTVAQRINNSGTFLQEAVFNYDVLGNLKEVKPPNFYSPPTGSQPNDWLTTYTYNTLGHMTQKETPDGRHCKIFI